MPRARILKPDFFRSEDIGALPPMARLLFAGLWTLADRDGRLLDRPRRIAADLFPYDDDPAVDENLNKIAARQLIYRYETNGQRCIQIATFAKHQTPHHREPSLGLPSPNKASALSDSVGQSQGLARFRPQLGRSDPDPGMDPVMDPDPDPDPVPDRVGQSGLTIPQGEDRSPREPRRPIDRFGAATSGAFQRVLDAYPRKDARVAAGVAFQDLASTWPGGEEALAAAMLAAFPAMLARAPYNGPNAKRPFLEKVICERRFEDPPSAPDDEEHRTNGRAGGFTDEKWAAAKAEVMERLKR